MSTAPCRLLIVGAGSLARELLSWVRSDQAWTGPAFSGFLSDELDALSAYPMYKPGVVGRIVDYKMEPGDLLLMAIADPKAKLAIAADLESRGAKFGSFIHSTVLIADHVAIGRGVVICPNAVVSCHAVVGDFATINLSSTVGHDVKLGPGVTLSAHVDLTGFAVVEEGAFLGSHAAVLPRAKVGAYAKVGAGTVVLRSVNAGATVMGVPAKQIFP